MQLKEGNLAIDFTVNDLHGQPITLSHFKGQKILLSFMRNVSCPFCNMRVHKLLSNKLRLQRSGLQVILFFESSPERLRESVLHQGISPWPLIGDLEKRVYERYGIEESYLKMLHAIIYPSTHATVRDARALPPTGTPDSKYTAELIPADFLIGPDFRIARAYYGKHTNDHIDINAIHAFAEGK